jgi:hypothetical protein
MPPAARAVIPPAYHRVVAAGDLEIYARDPAHTAPTSAGP